jgi:SAM-dependent methyltransferase
MTDYESSEYISSKRFQSYYEQLKCIKSISGNAILEIGTGNGLFRHMATRMGKSVTTLDINPSLNPDICASILNTLPLKAKTFDAVVAFEVFEHVPFHNLVNILNEIARVSTEGAIFSVPNREWHVRLLFATDYFKLGGLLTIRRLFKRYKPLSDYAGDRHYWHIGDKGITLGTVRERIRQSDLSLLKDYRSKGNPGHHFFTLLSK